MPDTDFSLPISLFDIPVAVVELDQDGVRAIAANRAWELDPTLGVEIPSINAANGNRPDASQSQLLAAGVARAARERTTVCIECGRAGGATHMVSIRALGAGKPRQFALVAEHFSCGRCLEGPDLIPAADAEPHGGVPEMAPRRPQPGLAERPTAFAPAPDMQPVTAPPAAASLKGLVTNGLSGAVARKVPQTLFATTDLVASKPVAATFGSPTRAPLRDNSNLRRQLEFALEIASDGFWEWNLTSGTVICSDRMHQLLGYRPLELDDSIEALMALVHPTDRDELIRRVDAHLAGTSALLESEHRYRRRDGNWQWVLVRGRIVEHDADGQPVRLICACVDIHRSKQASELIRHLATRDSLTGLANRHMFNEELTLACGRVRRTGRGFAMMLLDLDRFKQVNDLLGHATGDALLREVARRLRDCLRRRDVVARLGGDEFAILTSSDPASGEVAIIAERICAAIAKPIVVGDNVIQTGASVGVTHCPDHASEPQALLGNADIALYDAKGAGRGRWSVFDRRMQDRARLKASLDEDLRRAVERGELMLHYQPVLDLEKLSVKGVEALLRWYHPQRGVVYPRDFIGLAERNGLTSSISLWVVGQALSELTRWREEGLDLPTLHVNLAGSMLRADDWVDRFSEKLYKSGLPARCLVLEIAESELLDDEKAVDILQQLSRLGVGLAVDDFGTGHSSIARLRDLPFKMIKLDRSFTIGALESEKGHAVVEWMVELGRRLGLVCVAEGIETTEQLRLAVQLGCLTGQGQLFARPLPAAELPAWLRSWSDRQRLMPEFDLLRSRSGVGYSRPS